MNDGRIGGIAAGYRSVRDGTEDRLGRDPDQLTTDH